MAAHIAGGTVALVAGAAAMIARKGGPIHGRAGTWFVGSMLVLWSTATLLDLLEGKLSAVVGNLFIAYFVATSWVAARRHDGATGGFEIVACAGALVLAAMIGWGAFTGVAAPTPVGMGPVFAIAGFCLLAGLLDLSAILRARLTVAQRISRHLWRMCCAFFIATGSFFLGQQDAMPLAVRGSPALVVLAFAPFAAMAFWLVRVRFGQGLRRALDALGDGQGPRSHPARPPDPGLMKRGRAGEGRHLGVDAKDLMDCP